MQERSRIGVITVNVIAPAIEIRTSKISVKVLTPAIEEKTGLLKFSHRKWTKYIKVGYRLEA